MTTAQTPEDTLTRSRAQTNEWILVRRFVDPNAPWVRKRYRASVAAMLDVSEKRLSEHLASSSGEQPMNGWLCRVIDTTSGVIIAPPAVAGFKSTSTVDQYVQYSDDRRPRWRSRDGDYDSDHDGDGARETRP